MEKLRFRTKVNTLSFPYRHLPNVKPDSLSAINVCRSYFKLELPKAGATSCSLAKQTDNSLWIIRWWKHVSVPCRHYFRNFPINFISSHPDLLLLCNRWMGANWRQLRNIIFYIFCDDVNERRKKNFFASCIISDCELISAYVESSSASETPFDWRRLELALEITSKLFLETLHKNCTGNKFVCSPELLV